MGAGASSAPAGSINLDADIRALSRRALSRTQIKHAAGRMLAIRRGFATVGDLSQHAAMCSVPERTVLQRELNELVAVIAKSCRRQRVPSESRISGGQQVCKCCAGACCCLCLYCGEQGHSGKLCKRRVEHAEPPEASRSWLAAARAVPSTAADVFARGRLVADAFEAAPRIGDQLERTTTRTPAHEMTDAQLQRAAEHLARHNTLQLRDELKAVPHCAALKRVNELVDAITWEAPPPDFWPTPTRTTAAENAVADAQATLTDHERSMVLDGGFAVSAMTVQTAGSWANTTVASPITPELVDRLSQLPGWRTHEDDSKMTSPRAEELLLESQKEYATLHSSAQEAWFEHYRDTIGKSRLGTV